MFNSGYGYDNSSGVFIAPIDGMYSLGTVLCAAANRFVCFGIVVNGVKITNGCIKGHDPNKPQCTATTATAVLLSGGKAWVESTDSDGLYFKETFRRNTFIGGLKYTY